jgi:hypothetical protein
MRVTQSIVSRNLLNSINQTQVSLSKSQNEISTGTAVANRRIIRPVLPKPLNTAIPLPPMKLT